MWVGPGFGRAFFWPGGAVYKSPFDHDFEFSVTLKNGGVSVTLSASVAGADLPMLPASDLESSELISHICSLAIEATARDAAVAVHRAHARFSQALDQAGIEYRHSSNSFPDSGG
jgi:hypothetical protein